MHMHAGWMGLSSACLHGAALQDHAVGNSLSILSVGRGLALEDPSPARPEDCCDDAEWLIDNAGGRFGATLGLVGSESAGAHLALFDAWHLMQHQEPVYSTFILKELT